MNSVSEPPINIREKGEKITFADVAMRIARDGPMYGVLILVGLLALKGTADAMQSIMGAALALLARSWPGAIQTSSNPARGAGNMGIGMGLAVIAIMSGSLSACWAGSDTDLRSADYAQSLESCNRRSTTLCESIRCENHVRATHGQVPRALPVHCVPDVDVYDEAKSKSKGGADAGQ